jgi:hypothetical protein
MFATNTTGENGDRQFRFSGTFPTYGHMFNPGKNMGRTRKEMCLFSRTIKLL